MKTKHVRNAVGVFLCFALLSGAAGCGSKNETAKDELPVITWYVPGSSMSGTQDVMDEVNKILPEKIGAKLSLQFIDMGAFSERMKMNMASGKELDLLFTGWVNPFTTGVENGSYTDLTDYLPTLAPELWADMPEYVWDFSSVNGRIYAVPNQQIYALPPGIEIDKTIVEKYKDRFDFNSVKCMEDFEPFLKLIKENEPDMIPYRLNFLDTMWTYGKVELVTSGFVIDVNDPNHKVVPSYEIPETIKCYKTLTDWFNKGYIRADIDSCGDDNADYNAGVYACSTQLYKPGFEVMVKNATGRDVEFFTWYDRAFMAKNGASQTMTAIGNTSKHVEECVKFLNLINTDKEIYNLICFGIEGKNYTVGNDGKIILDKESDYFPNSDWKFGNQFNAKLVQGQKDDIWEETKKINDDSVKSPLIGFTFNSDPVKTEVSNLASLPDVSALRFSEESLNECIAKRKQAGADKVQQEAQRQIDEFFANKKGE